MKTIANNINTEIMRKYEKDLLQAFIQDRYVHRYKPSAVRIEYCLLLGVVYRELQAHGNDKGGARSVILNALRKALRTQDVFNDPSLNEHCQLAEILYEAEQGTFSFTGINSPEDFTLASYPAMIAQGRALQAQYEERAMEKPAQEFDLPIEELPDSWVQAFATFHDGQARLHEELAARLRGLAD